MLTEIIRSCRHAFVADAAIRSIGGNFAEGVRHVANSHGMSLGHYTAKVVRHFEKTASPATRQALHVAIRRTDQPILAGLRFILDRAQDDDSDSEWSGCSVAEPHRGDLACHAAWH